jgi:hypothetical protein
VDACQELLKYFEVEGDGFLGTVVMGDETWVHYHELDTTKASKKWCHTSFTKTEKIPHTTICGKGYADCL